VSITPPSTPPGDPQHRRWPIKVCPRCHELATSENGRDYECINEHKFPGEGAKDYQGNGAENDRNQ